MPADVTVPIRLAIELGQLPDVVAALAAQDRALTALKDQSAATLADHAADLAGINASLTTINAGIANMTAALAGLTKAVTAMRQPPRPLPTPIAAIPVANDPVPSDVVPPIPPSPAAAPVSRPSWPAVAAGPGTDCPTLALALAACKPGGAIVLEDGRYGFDAAAGQVTPQHGTADAPLSISARNPGQVVFDGEGFTEDGKDGPKGLLGKALIHVSGAVILRGIRFVGAGARERPANGKAAVWVGDGPASAAIIDCQFDGCCNGVFSGPKAAGVTLTRCVFGRDESNGQSRDGRSHDAYCFGAAVLATDCCHYGNAYGTAFKTRAAATTIERGLYRAAGGYAIEAAGGGRLRMNGGYIAAAAKGSAGKLLGFGTEDSALGRADATLAECTVVAIGRQNAIFVGDGAVAFANPNAVFVGGEFTVAGHGTVTGLPLDPSKGGIVSASAPPMPAFPAGPRP